MSDRPDRAPTQLAEHRLGVWGALRPNGPRELVTILASAGLVLLAFVIAVLSQVSASPAGLSPAVPTSAATSAPAPVPPPLAAPTGPRTPEIPGAPKTSVPNRGDIRTGPTHPQAGVPAGPPAPSQPETRTYQVRSGDTLAAIALQHGVDYQRIAADNHLTDPNVIRAGERLRIGQPTPGVRVIQPGETLGNLAVATGLSIPQLLALNPGISNPNRILAGAGLRVHT